MGKKVVEKTHKKKEGWWCWSVDDDDDCSAVDKIKGVGFFVKKFLLKK